MPRSEIQKLFLSFMTFIVLSLDMLVMIGGVGVLPGMFGVAFCGTGILSFVYFSKLLAGLTKHFELTRAEPTTAPPT